MLSCSLPPPLSPDQLSAALDGAADPGVIAHLAQCASCAARLETARLAENDLRRQLFRWDCPTPQQLGDFQQGLLAQSEAAVMAQHLEQCALCARELRDLNEFLAAPPQAQPVAQPQRRRRPATLGERVAQLLPRTFSPALRGEGRAPITAQATGLTLVLDVQPAAGGEVVVQGQVAAADQDRWTGALVTLRQSGELKAIALVDDLGAFRLQGLPTALSVLRFTPTAGQPVLLRDVDLAA